MQGIMMKTTDFLPKKHTLRRKLFAYMFTLVAFLLLLFFVGTFLVGGYSGTKHQIAETLEFQSQVFERQIASHYSNLAVMGIQLSECTSQELEQYLDAQGLGFSALKGSQTHIAEIQEALIEPLRQKLLETDCSGAFILLDTQVNPEADNAETSRSGLYLQRNSLDSTDTRILLYRGLADVGKLHDAMPHRKWRLEFDTNLFPGYEDLTGLPADSLTENYRLSQVVTLPGTSERVMLLSIPIYGRSGQYYGICGLEISESYFKHIFAQPSELDHGVFCLSRGQIGMTDARESLTAGIVDDYYLAPSGQFRSRPFGHGLFSCESEDSAYVGIIRTLRLCPGRELFSVSTLMPREDYDRLAAGNSLRVTLMLLVLVAFAAVCCLYFSKRYLKPLMQSMAQIRQKEYASSSRVVEIDDLFAYLAEQDRQSQQLLAAVREEKASVETALARLRTEQAQDKQELQRLAYSRKSEVDPEDYENFRRGIRDLTATERRVFDYYLEGRTVKEITELMGVKESTVRFHNRNLYTTLGVSSLKQLLRCAAILKQEGEQALPPSGEEQPLPE